MAVVKAFKWMRILSDAEEIRKKKEQTKNNSPAEFEDYQEIMQIRNMAFIELLRAKIPFIYIEDDDIVKINLDEMSYDMDSNILKSLIGEDEFKSLIENPNYDPAFNPDKELYVEEQKNDEFEILQKKILSYGASVDSAYIEDNITTKNKTSSHSNERFENDIDENSNEQFLDYRIDKNGHAKAINTTEYAFMGLEHGVGTTHIAMLTAMQLAKQEDNKVAFIEINNSGKMRDLGEWISGQNIMTNNYPLGNVDVFFGIDYLSFTAMYRDNYDYVIIDFGCYSKKRESIKEFIRIKNKYIIASGVDWNLPTLADFYEDFIVDISNTAVYLIPYLTDKLLEPVKKIVQPNKVMSIPFNINPFVIEEKTLPIIKEIIGQKDNNNEEADTSFTSIQKKGLFGRFFKEKK